MSIKFCIQLFQVEGKMLITLKIINIFKIDWFRFKGKSS